MKKNIVIYLTLLLLAANHLLAQVSTNFNNSTRITNRGKFEKVYEQNIDLEIPAKNIEALTETERQEKLKSPETKPLKIAIPVAININLVNLINWTSDEQFAYGKYTIKLTSALSASINFDKFYLPKGTEMYVYSENGEMITGAVTENENNENKKWGSWVYKGELITIEIKTPIATKNNLLLHSSNVAYGYKEIYKSIKVSNGNFGMSGYCNINVICPLGIGWELERNSVSTLLSANGGEFCTGSLIMNTCGTNKPYYLTANHCFAGGIPDASGWRFSFQEWSPSCPNPGTNISNVTYNGSILKARNATSDFCLVELNTTPPANSGLHYAGWNRGTTPAIQTTAIHHPSGDVMKISRANSTATRTGYGATGNDHWQANWSQGVTEQGSSGSPLFDQNHRIIGQLHGGPSACGGSQLWDFYGSFDVSWTGGGTPSTRLSDWLDPFNTGAMTTNTTDIASLVAPITLPVISGLSSFCSGSGALYTLSPVPAGVTINWQTTKGISVVGGQGSHTASISGYGRGTIFATITPVCGASYTTPAFSVSVQYPLGLGVSYTFSNGSTLGALGIAYFEGGDGELTNINNLCVGYTSGGYLTASVSSGSLVTFTALGGATTSYRTPTTAWLNLASGAVGVVQVTATSGCGTVTQLLAFQATNCGSPNNPSDPTSPPNPCNNPPKLYNISPNPATGYIKIGISEKPIPIECPKIKNIIESKDGLTFSSVNIHNHFGKLVLSQQTDKAKEFTIPLKELKAGLYLVQITEGEHAEQHQIIIE